MADQNRKHPLGMAFALIKVWSGNKPGKFRPGLISPLSSKSMKTYIYLLVGLSFFGFSPLLRAELPPVLDILRVEKIQEIKKLLQTELGTQDFQVQLNWQATTRSAPAKPSWKIKKINGDYPKEGRFLPKETEILGDTQFILRKQEANISIQTRLSQEKAAKLQSQIKTLLVLNNKRGDQLHLNFKLRPAVPVAKAKAPSLTPEEAVLLEAKARLNSAPKPCKP